MVTDWVTGKEDTLPRASPQIDTGKRPSVAEAALGITFEAVSINERALKGS